jgi:hypothetical protein
MSGVFISYRRGPVASIAAGRILDHLRNELGKVTVFMDVDTIAPGDDFVTAVNQYVGECDVLLAVIDPEWLEATDEAGNRRLENPVDYVRLEIAAALDRGVRVIPVLVEQATVPTADELPEALRLLARRQALVLSRDRWATDIDPLVATVLREVELKANSGERSGPSKSLTTDPPDSRPDDNDSTGVPWKALPQKPGWYSDPEGNQPYEAFWDGQRWSGATRPKPMSGPVIGKTRMRPLGWEVGLVLMVAGAGWFLFALFFVPVILNEGGDLTEVTIEGLVPGAIAGAIGISLFRAGRSKR